MKSPWKLLARLIPQRRSAETTDEPTEPSPSGQERQEQSPDAQLKLPKASPGSEHQEFQPTELTISSPDHVSGETGISLPSTGRDDDKALQASARRQATRSGDQPYTTQRGSRAQKKGASPATPTRDLERAKKRNATTLTPDGDIAKKDRAVQIPSSQNVFLDDVADLDKDIKQLRMQLAQKLNLQNVQLKKMLGRFDAS